MNQGGFSTGGYPVESPPFSPEGSFMVGLSRDRARMTVKAAARKMGRGMKWIKDCLISVKESAKDSKVLMALFSLPALGIGLVVLVLSAVIYHYVVEHNERLKQAEALRDLVLSSYDTSEGEECRQFNSVTTAAEGAAEDNYGVELWQKMWQKYERVFENAQDVALDRIMANLTHAQLEVWPSLGPLPSEPDKGEERSKYLERLRKWRDDNLMTIPHLKFRIEGKYRNMFDEETFRSLYKSSNYVKGSMALNEVIYGRLGLPPYCLVGEVYESHAIKDKMMNLRSNKAIRDAKMDAAINKHYVLRNELTVAKMSEL